MPKTLIIQGCKDCPYKSRLIDGWYCFKDHEEKGFDFFISKSTDYLPDTPHQDCKLNDLPTKNEITHYSDRRFDFSDEMEIFEKGANWVIKQISK